ncbi:hypothetical protein BDC45DRAFT_556830 [Circinella umbellata]|nr:hypothetical protein BDC45DRAFT_556830 [Circinella umbellata]
MGLLRFSRKDKLSTDSPNTPTPTPTPKKRAEISSTDTIPGNYHYKLHNQKEKKNNRRQQKTISRDFFSSSSFKAIIGERGSLMDDILNELRPEDILEEEAESDGVMMPVPRTSTSVSTMTFNSTTSPTSIANTTKIPTPIATKSAILPRQSISSKSSNSHKGFLAQKYMEASNRRYRQSQQQQQQQQRRTASSESSNNRIARPTFTTTMKRADLGCEIDHKCRKNKANNKQQSDILPVAAQQQQKDQASRRSRSVPVAHQIPVINEPADSESSALPQRQQQLLQNSATQKRDLLHPGGALQMHSPPTPPPDVEDEVEKTINVSSFQHRRGCDKGTMTTESYLGNHQYHYIHHNNCHHHHYYHDDHFLSNKNHYHMCSHKQEQHYHHCSNNFIFNPCQHHPHHHSISHPTTPNTNNNSNNHNNNMHRQQCPSQSHPNHHNHNLDHHHCSNTNHHCHHHNCHETHVRPPQHHHCCIPLPQQTHRQFHCFCTSPPIVCAQPPLCHHHHNHHCSNHQRDVRQSAPDVVLPSQSVPSPRTSKGKDRAVRSSQYYNNAGHCCHNNNTNNNEGNV